MNKSILVACPTSGLDPDPSRWLESFMRIQNQIRALGFSQAFIAPYRMTWPAANNQIWNVAFEYDFDYILRIDDDIHGVPDNAIKLLLDADKDVIGAAYPSRHFPHAWCALTRSPEAEGENLIEIAQKALPVLKEVSGDGVLQVDMIGFGMCLIKVSSFKDVQGHLFDDKWDVPDDTIFANLCEKLGVKQFVNMDVKLCHRDITPMLKSAKKEADNDNLKK